jgi:hypothetical protein
MKTIRNIITVANNYGINVRELYDNVINEVEDFEVDNYRFIKESEALNEAVNMYKGDNYMLGCFNADFISDNTNLSYNVVKALQKAEAFEELGELISDNDLDSFIEEYARLDGWGHVFGSYDGDNDEITFNDVDYIVFRVN